MLANTAAENALGTIGTICWTIQLIPQVWKSWRAKSTDGLSHWLVLLWAISGPFLFIYAVVEKLSIPLILQPQLFSFLSLISWGQCLHYEKKFSTKLSVLVVVAILAVIGGFEAAMIQVIRPHYPQEPSAVRAIQFFGIFTSVLIAIALLPQYYEIHQRKEVVGISISFMLIDLAGALFSDLSLIFKAEFPPIAAVTYSVVFVMDIAVIIAAAILNPRQARKRRIAASQLSEMSQNGSHSLITVPESTEQHV
ncbi:PQ loop repeat-domain-containing protein [Mycena floridula]|nr:PQ loop repeat-domain-containing protein [Mycena floridula]